MSEPTLEPLSRQQVLRLLTAQGLVLLIVSFGWLLFQPDLPLYTTLNWQHQTLFWGLAGAAIMLSVSGIIFLTWSDLRKAIREVDRLAIGQLRYADIPYVALISGISEEIFFRGILQNAFGLLVASLLFGLVHIPGPRYWHYAIWATAAGYGIGWLYQATGNLWAAIIVHVLNNAVALACWLKWRHRLAK